jgi:glucosyl-dolichyl phosphate glucuronosyltransferase
MISVIIPTFNRASLLKLTLNSIVNQTLQQDEFEVLVIDNASTDSTKEVTLSFEKSFKHLRYIYEAAPGLHAGRHRGMKESRGEILVFADDDIDALPVWLEGIKESFQDASVGMVGGKNIPNYESEPPPWMDQLWETTPDGKYITYFSLLDFGDQVKSIDPRFVFGCNFSVRKDLLQKIKGFHPDGMPGPMLRFRGDGETFVAEQVQAAGYKTIYHPKASVKHWVPASRMNRDYIKKRAYAEGITRSYSDTRKHLLTSEPGLLKLLKSKISRLLMTDLQKEIADATAAGYRFHQTEMKRDQALRDWVLKEHYLD